VWCHFPDLNKGVVDFRKYLSTHNPEVVIFDISQPTTNKDRVDAC
jgi:hypothetical protein